MLKPAERCKRMKVFTQVRRKVIPSALLRGGDSDAINSAQCFLCIASPECCRPWMPAGCRLSMMQLGSAWMASLGLYAEVAQMLKA